MAVDDNYTIRQQALQKILESREKTNPNKIRKFSLPKLNFSATDYTKLINWNKCSITEPPVLSHVQDEDLQLLVLEQHEDLKEMLKFPCHTQSVERMIKLVTEASSSVYSYQARHNSIRAKLKSRKQVSKFSNKKDYLRLL